MSNILDLKDCSVFVLDGFSGTAAVDDMSISAGNTTLDIDTIADFTDDTTVVPVGARFTIAGVDETYTVTAQNANKVFTVTIDDTSGNFTLTFNGETTASIAYNAIPSAVQSALEALTTPVAGDFSVTGSAGAWVIECKGAYLGLSTPTLTGSDVNLMGGSGMVTVTTTQPGATTWEVTFTPALVSSDLPSNDDVITFDSQKIEIGIGEGNATWTETKEREYRRDRGRLNTVRDGDEQPLELSLDFDWTFVRTGTGETITPVDAIKGIGGAADWFPSSTDPCEPFCCDILIEYRPPCGSSQGEDYLFPEFRWESMDYDLNAATISVKGKCNAEEPTITRVDS